MTSPAPRSWPRRLGGWLPGLLATLALAALLLYLLEQREYIARTYALRPWTFVALCLLTLATMSLRALANRSLFRPLGVHAAFRDWLGVVSVHSLANYLPFQAGVLAKAFVLKRLHDVPYSTFAAVELALLVLVVAANGAVGLIALALFMPVSVFSWLGLTCAAMLSSVSVLLIPQRWLGGLSRWLRWEVQASPAVRRAWPGVLAWQIAALLVMSFALYLAFAAGATPVTYAASVLFAACAVAARLLSIVPGSIGVREFLIGGLSHLAGFEFRDGVIASSSGTA
jgi:uncharacterized membrane protein YbhN (UPF0104 family)